MPAQASHLSGYGRDVLTRRMSADTSPPSAPAPAPALPRPLPVHPPTKALLAAFKGDLPAALLADTYYRAQQFVAMHGDEISSELQDLLQVSLQWPSGNSVSVSRFGKFVPIRTQMQYGKSCFCCRGLRRRSCRARLAVGQMLRWWRSACSWRKWLTCVPPGRTGERVTQLERAMSGMSFAQMTVHASALQSCTSVQEEP